MIILEGMDNSGKSTLAKRLALQVIHPGAPPKSAVLEQQFFDQQIAMANRPVIYDRVTCISQQIYQKRLFDVWYMVPLMKMIKMTHCVVVYCRPNTEWLLDVEKHTVAEHDTPEMLENVRQNAKFFVESYDKLMNHIPHIKYDFNVGMHHETVIELLKMQFNEQAWKLWTREQKAMRFSS